jgi:hypothetical protein
MVQLLLLLAVVVEVLEIQKSFKEVTVVLVEVVVKEMTLLIIVVQELRIKEMMVVMDTKVVLCLVVGEVVQLPQEQILPKQV